MRETLTAIFCLILFGIALQTGLIHTGLDFDSLKKEKDTLQAANDSLSDEIQRLRSEESSERPRWTPEQRNRAEHVKAVLQSVLDKEIQKGNVVLSATGTPLLITLQDSYLFSPGSLVVRPEARNLLAVIGKTIGPLTDIEVQISGHTDNQALRGVEAKRYGDLLNWSLLKASVITKVLEAEGGLDPVRMMTVGFGGNRPFLPNHSPEARTKNQRVTLMLHPLRPELIQQALDLMGAQAASVAPTEQQPTPVPAPTVAPKAASPKPRTPAEAEPQEQESIGEDALDELNTDEFDAGYEKPSL